MEILWTLGSVVLVSLLSVLVALPLLVKKLNHSFLLALLSLSVGALLGGVFIHLLPEAMEEVDSLAVPLLVLTGFLLFFILEKFIHHHHHHTHKEHTDEPHGHAYHLAPLNLIGDGVHNFLDGLVIAGAYAVSLPTGIAATIGVIVHELPQEFADFGILLYAGLSRIKALLFNFFSALAALLGAIVGLVISSSSEFAALLVALAAGNFIYIAASNLVPELHRKCSIFETILHVMMIILGIGIMLAIAIFIPEVH